MISVLSPMPSQCALQYFCFSGGMQLQAGFAHFLVPDIITSEAEPDQGVWNTRAWVVLMRSLDEKDAGEVGGAPR